MEFLENRRSWENQKPPENRQRSGLFWASPFTMHLVCTLLTIVLTQVFSSVDWSTLGWEAAQRRSFRPGIYPAPRGYTITHRMITEPKFNFNTIGAESITYIKKIGGNLFDVTRCSTLHHLNCQEFIWCNVFWCCSFGVVMVPLRFMHIHDAGSLDILLCLCKLKTRCNGLHHKNRNNFNM